MIEMGKKYQTRDGRVVRILCVDGPGEDYPVIGVIEGQKHTDSWTAKGLMSKSVAFPMGNLDLILVPTKHEGWAIITKRISGIYFFSQNLRDSEGEAQHDMRECSDGIGTLGIARVLWED